jgi:hypothetical protein
MIIIAGQSNASGSSLEPLLPNHKIPNSKITQYSRGKNKTFNGKWLYTYKPGKNGDIIPALHPLQHHGIADPESAGFALTFCESYIKDNPNKKILIMPCALGGTGFRPSTGHIITWDKNITWANKNLYNEMITDCNKVLQLNPNMKVMCILWHQGESDINNWEYPTKLDELVRNLRKDLHNNRGINTNFICGTMLNSWKQLGSGTKYIDQAHKNIKWRFNDNMTDCCNFDHITGVTNDGMNVHFDQKSLEQMGKEFYIKFKEMTSSKKSIDKNINNNKNQNRDINKKEEKDKEKYKEEDKKEEEEDRLNKIYTQLVQDECKFEDDDEIIKI